MAAKTYLMRWNPAISSYKLEVYHNNCKDFPYGFRIDWSIWDYAEAHEGDCFVMMRVGEYKPGLVFYGIFVSEPYTDEDWAGTDKLRHYVLMDCFGFREKDEPIVSPAELSDAIPGIDWMAGHSGVMLSEDEAERLTSLLEAKVEDFSFNPDLGYTAEDDMDESVNPSECLCELLEDFAEFSPSIHSQSDEGFDWLESDEDWCKCLVIPNPIDRKYDVEVEVNQDFILYFAGAHVHYESTRLGFDTLTQDLLDIVYNNARWAYSGSYEGFQWCSGMSDLYFPEDYSELFTSNNEYKLRMLAEYTEKDVKPDGIIILDTFFFNPSLNKQYSFRMDELSDKVKLYQKRQAEVRLLYGNSQP